MTTRRIVQDFIIIVIGAFGLVGTAGATPPAGLPACIANLNTCTANLSSCQTQLAGCQHFPATGQTTCYSNTNVIPCAGTGQDGDIRAGGTLSYTDNRDGTITDNNTKLMWEKKSWDGTIHDQGNLYSWQDAFATFIVALNTPPCFAGHCDWRLPNVRELQSIVDYNIAFVGLPAISDAFFNNFFQGCTVLTCSLTAFPFGSSYWSSTTLASNTFSTWAVTFDDGSVVPIQSAFGAQSHVRAVRGGL